MPYDATESVATLDTPQAFDYRSKVDPDFWSKVDPDATSFPSWFSW